MYNNTTHYKFYSYEALFLFYIQSQICESIGRTRTEKAEAFHVGPFIAVYIVLVYLIVEDRTVVYNS